MAESGRYFYRSYSNTSAGGLVSGKRRRVGQSLGIDLNREFSNHVQAKRTEPTALISVSCRILDTLQRAFNKFHRDNENRNQIWIAIIYVPDSDKNVYYHAKDLAMKFDFEECNKFKYEYIFTWEIPQKYVQHKVTVETLMNRGLKLGDYVREPVLPPTSELRKKVAKKLLNLSHGKHDIGLSLGFLARCFGARAPTNKIACQLLMDCSHVVQTYDDDFMIKIEYAEGHEALLDSGDLCNIQEGIDTALIDWWLTDSCFLDAYEEHCALAFRIKEDMEKEWEYWRHEMCDQVMNGHLDVETYRNYGQELPAREDQLDAKIERYAIKLGL